MAAERDKRIDGEYDPPLPERSDTLSTEDIEKLEKLFQRYPNLKERYGWKYDRRPREQILEDQ